jgi:hypothetical protein
MKWKLTTRRFAAVLVTAGLAVGGLLAVAGGAAATSTSASTAASSTAAGAGGTWGVAKQISGTMDKATYPGVGSLSCTGVGDCTGVSARYAVTEEKGVWSAAQTIPGMPGAVRPHPVIACTSPGDCVVAGSYATGKNTSRAFVVAQVNGTWRKAQPISDGGLPGRVSDAATTLSCPTSGNCTAAGEYTTKSGAGAFTVAEVRGTWKVARALPGIARFVGAKSGSATVTSLSCGAVGACSVAGSYLNAATKATTAFVASSASGDWAAARPIPGLALAGSGNSTVTMISCRPAGYCLAGGSVGKVAFIASQVSGSWRDATTVPGLAALGGANANPVAFQASHVSAVSCSAAASCTIAGEYNNVNRSGSNGVSVFAASEAAGVWTDATQIDGVGNVDGLQGDHAAVHAMACTSAGSCVIGGSFTSTPFVSAFVASSADGVWGDAIQVPMPERDFGLDYSEVDALSCPLAGHCGAAVYGAVVDETPSLSPYYQYMDNEANATTAELTLSATEIVYGRENAERISVTVTSPAGTPPGTVRVTANSNEITVCTIALKSGNGSCALTAKQLQGHYAYSLAGTYLGAATFASSVSNTQTVGVNN